jgi:uncharacterized protein
VSPLEHLLAFLVVLVGAAIQGAVGFGANLFAAPLLVLIDPKLVPGPVVVGTSVLNVLVVRREPSPEAWREMRWAIVGSVPGAVAGAAVLSVIAGRSLAIFFGTLVLVAVGLSLSGLHPERDDVSMAAAGSLSGFMGTAVGIGGPPIALLFQKAEGPEIRSALSRFFLIGGIVSLVMLAVFGELGWGELGQGVLLVPGTIAGYLLSSRLLAHVDRERVRVAVLVLSAASAAIAILRALL